MMTVLHYKDVSDYIDDVLKVNEEFVLFFKGIESYEGCLSFEHLQVFKGIILRSLGNDERFNEFFVGD